MTGARCKPRDVVWSGAQCWLRDIVVWARARYWLRDVVVMAGARCKSGMNVILQPMGYELNSCK